jgi:hypothetical protein
MSIDHSSEVRALLRRHGVELDVGNIYLQHGKVMKIESSGVVAVVGTKEKLDLTVSNATTLIIVNTILEKLNFQGKTIAFNSTLMNTAANNVEVYNCQIICDSNKPKYTESRNNAVVYNTF